MKTFSVALFLVYSLVSALQGGENLDRARQVEKSGDAMGARALLAHAVQAAPDNVAALSDYAEFLDSHGDPAWKEVYPKLLSVLEKSGNKQRTTGVARRIADLYLLEGDRAAAQRYLDAAGLTLPGTQATSPETKEARQTIQIPGPLRSFSRMTAVSTETQSEDLLAALARNVVTNGFQASHSNEALEQTEYLKLVHRYLSQARELDGLAGPDKVIKLDNCDSPQAGELLKTLGFRMRGGCGSELVLETVNATRAFLTTDSGFPIPELEQALRTNRPFSYDYRPTTIPVMFGADYWLSAKEKENGEFIDIFLSDPALCRFYLGMSKLDRETAEDFRKNIPMPRLRAYSHVLDFFGGMFEVRHGKAIVPGTQKAAPVWAELAGASPDQGAAFFEKLLARDDGWMASYFDALARINGPVRDYLTEPARLKRFYTAIRGRVTSPGPARPVFRSNADMMLLTNRLWIEPDGRPHIPGNLEVWKELFVNHPQGKYDGKLTRSAAGWKEPDDVLEALFGLSRKAVENEPLKIFMALSDLDRNRAKPLAPETVDRLAREYHQFGQQYPIFNDAATLTDKSMVQYLDTADEINRLKDLGLKADTAGTLQGAVGLWQIFSRQGSLPAAKADETFASMLAPFAEVRSERMLFDAGSNAVKLLMAATGASKEDHPQNWMVDLLAGAANPSDVESHTQVVQDMVRILEAQRIISLDDILDFGSQLDAAAKGEKVNSALVNRLASRISEIPFPRASLSAVEKNALSFGFWTEKHIDSERKLNLKAAMEKATGEKIRDLRSLMAPFLRDTLVAYNYVHYAPPGAQVLYTNPVFVRSHDFLGVQGTNHMWRSTEVFGSGWPSNGGGRLVGSLAGLPYALAEAEQNFLVPDQTQALIWGDLVPQMMLSAVIPRWWNVTHSQMHWVALHLRYAESLLAESALNRELRQQVLDALSLQAAPVRVRQVQTLLEQGEVKAAAAKVTPSELFVLASRMRSEKARTEAGVNEAGSSLLAEMHRLAAESPQEVNYQAVSAAFGTPKPTLANSYRPELLNLRTFPTLMGYSSRILAESWESNTLYWAELADETYTQPSQLNVRIPEWTQKLVEHIFASHLEDWPAVLRSLRTVGDDVRAKAKPQLLAEQKAALQ
ncbi:MAG: hypothetical protein U0Q18_06375 [Bryobacteraceae bacterium]